MGSTCDTPKNVFLHAHFTHFRPGRGKIAEWKPVLGPEAFLSTGSERGIPREAPHCQDI